MSSSERARTADREAAVELINTAYVDGQLDADERDTLASNALEARTLDEVSRTTAGLQRAEPVPPLVPSSTGGVLGVWHEALPGVRITLVLALLLCLSSVVLLAYS